MFDGDMTGYELAAQIIGFLGTITIVIGMQQKKYDHIVLCKIGNEFFAAVHYLLLGGYTGMLVNFASIFANGTYWYRIKKGKSTLPFQIAFAIVFVTLGALSWQGFISLFVIAAKLFSSVSLGIKNPRVIRILNLMSNPCWLTYNIFMQSLVAIISDSLVIGSVVIAVIRLDILKRGKAHKIEVSIPDAEASIPKEEKSTHEA